MMLIRVDGEDLTKEQLSDTPRGQALLDIAREKRQPINCLCRPDGRLLPLYTRRLDDFLILCRMPKAGKAHHPDCTFFGETTKHLCTSTTVFNQYDAAIVEDDQGITHLNLAVALHLPIPAKALFEKRARSMSKKVGATRSAPKATIDAQGLLRFLWHSARFNRWYPAMEGKRQWNTVAFHLQKVAHDMDVRGVRLDSRLVVIQQKIIKAAPLPLFIQHHQLQPARDMMMVIAKVKKTVTERQWTKFQLHGMREYLWCPDKVWQVMRYEHRDAEAVVNCEDGDHLIGLFGVNLIASGFAHVRYASFLPATSRFLPFLHPWEKKLMVNLVDQGRAFSVRLSPGDLSAGVALLDTDEKYTRLSVIPPGGQAFHDMGSWRWDAGQAVIPALPRCRSNVSVTRPTTENKVDSSPHRAAWAASILPAP